MPFGDLLQQTRVAARVSLRDLAKAVGKSAVYLSDIERGNRRPPALPLILRIAEVLDVDPEPLLQAAIDERDAVELELPEGRDGQRRQTALSLARMWDTLPDETLEEINKLLDKQKGAQP